MVIKGSTCLPSFIVTRVEDLYRWISLLNYCWTLNVELSYNSDGDARTVLANHHYTEVEGEEAGNTWAPPYLASVMADPFTNSCWTLDMR